MDKQKKITEVIRRQNCRCYLFAEKKTEIRQRIELQLPVTLTAENLLNSLNAKVYQPKVDGSKIALLNCSWYCKQAGNGISRRHIQGSKTAKGLQNVKILENRGPFYKKIEKSLTMPRRRHTELGLQAIC